MIILQRVQRDSDLVIWIRLTSGVDKRRLTNVLLSLADEDAEEGCSVDLIHEDGFISSAFQGFVLGIVPRIRDETVTISENRVLWTKTKEGWLEAYELVNALTTSSHQVLGDGDAVIEVELTLVPANR